MYEGDVVIGDDYVAEGGEAFFYSLGVCQLLVNCGMDERKEVYLYLHFIG